MWASQFSSKSWIIWGSPSKGARENFYVLHFVADDKSGNGNVSMVLQESAAVLVSECPTLFSNHYAYFLGNLFFDACFGLLPTGA